MDRILGLVQKAQQGDAGAFAELVRGHAPLVGSVAYRIVGDIELAADLAQETFLRAHRGLGDLEDPARFRSWICGIARNACIDHLRRRHLREVPLDRVDPEVRVRPDAGLEREELLEKVLSVLGDLPKVYRDVVVLHHLRDLSYREMSEMLDVPVATVESRLYRARKLLRERLRGHFPGGEFR